jgi:hypothetical protein
MQAFGAVLSYVSRAVSAFDRLREQSSQERSHPSKAGDFHQVTRPAEEAFSRGAARLAALTAEQYRLRFDQAKAELFRQVPFLAAPSRSGGDLVENMVRSHLVRQLDREVMDPLPLGALKLPEPLAKILALAASQNPGPTQ